MVSDAEPSGPDALLHRYVDGDLSPEERSALEARLPHEPVLRDKVATLQALGTLVREVSAPREGSGTLQGPRSEALWAAIEAELAAAGRDAADLSVADRSVADLGVTGGGEGGSAAHVPGTSALEPASRAGSVGSRSGLRVIEGGGSEGPVDAGVARGPRTPRRSETPDERRHRRAGITIGVLALAAAALLVWLRPGGDAPGEGAVARRSDAPDPVLDATPGDPEPSAAELAAARDEALGTEVLEVDFGTGAGTIFAVEGEGGERFAVVWLTEDGVSEDGTGDGTVPEETVVE